jgi:hypothetical protein
VNDELETAWKEAVVACFKTHPQNFLYGLGKTTKTQKIPDLLPQTEPETPTNVKLSMATFDEVCGRKHSWRTLRYHLRKEKIKTEDLSNKKQECQPVHCDSHCKSYVMKGNKNLKQYSVEDM